MHRANQEISYKLIAITIGLILFSGSISGTMPVVFADHVDLGELKAQAGKARESNPCKCEGVAELVLQIKDGTAFADITVTSKIGKVVPFSDEGSGKIKITPIAGKDKIPNNTTIITNTGSTTIHTSCSETIEPGSVNDIITIVSLVKIPPSANDPICKYGSTKDKQKPIVKIISPSALGKVSGDPLVAIVKAKDKKSGIDKVEVRLDKGAFLEATQIGITDHYEITFSGVVDDGKHKITAKATDNAGNKKRQSHNFNVKS